MEGGCSVPSWTLPDTLLPLAGFHLDPFDVINCNWECNGFHGLYESFP